MQVVSFDVTVKGGGQGRMGFMQVKQDMVQANECLNLRKIINLNPNCLISLAINM